jgi:hypothetical protein
MRLIDISENISDFPENIGPYSLYFYFILSKSSLNLSKESYISF